MRAARRGALAPGARGAITMGVTWYAIALYFHAATASLTEAYQPGIGLLRAVTSPAAVLLAVWLVAGLIRTDASLRVATSTCAGAIVVAVLLGVWVAGHHGSARAWQFPEARSLTATVRLAVFEPQFSNRSLMAIVANGVLAGLLLCSALLVSRRRRCASLP